MLSLSNETLWFFESSICKNIVHINLKLVTSVSLQTSRLYSNVWGPIYIAYYMIVTLRDREYQCMLQHNCFWLLFILIAGMRTIQWHLPLCETSQNSGRTALGLRNTPEILSFETKAILPGTLLTNNNSWMMLDNLFICEDVKYFYQYSTFSNELWYRIGIVSFSGRSSWPLFK